MIKLTREERVRAEEMAKVLFTQMTERKGISTAIPLALVCAGVIVLKAIGESEEAAHDLITRLYATTDVIVLPDKPNPKMS